MINETDECIMKTIKFAEICRSCRLTESLNVDLIVFPDSKSEKLTYGPIVRISSEPHSSK